MDVLGRGLLATGFRQHRDAQPDVIAFAKGVATSAPLELAAYDREARELYDAIEWCHRDDRRLLYFSSGGSIYGKFDQPKSELDPLFPLSAYGRHQIFCETVIRTAGIRHLIVRLPNVVGASGNQQQLIPALVTQALDGRVTVLRDAARDLIGIDDMTRAVIRLLDTCEDSEVVQVASGTSWPVTMIVAEIQQILGTSAEEEVRPGGDAQLFRTGKLRDLIGSEGEFPDDYPRRTLRRYVPDIARQLRGLRDLDRSPAELTE